MVEPAFNYSELSVPERLQLVGDIWDSLAREARLPVSDEDLAELERRSEEHRKNPGSAIPADKVIKDLYDAGS